MADTPAPGPALPVSCPCGSVSFTTPPLATRIAYCHCTSCRKQSGSAFGASIYYPTPIFFDTLPTDLVSSALSIYEYPTDSGNTMRGYFCPKCGTRVFNAVVLPDGKTLREVVAVKAGLVDDVGEGGLGWKGQKGVHIFTKSAVMELAEGWECYETMPGESK
ncbi:Mss4-like protein [Chaetomium sp. MPI-SDFR-AT-0129]|nr:Mss4-like protein [Chaetomium sp. MPI-SDFR-AT-0129]